MVVWKWKGTVTGSLLLLAVLALKEQWEKSKNHLFPLYVFVCTMHTYNIGECTFLFTMKNFEIIVSSSCFSIIVTEN